MTDKEIKEMWENSNTHTQDDQDGNESNDALDGCMRRCEAKAGHHRRDRHLSDRHLRDRHRRDHQERGDYVTMKDFLSRPKEC